MEVFSIGGGDTPLDGTGGENWRKAESAMVSESVKEEPCEDKGK